jgi:GH35 family endo-1,4-beta-xylanase
MKFNLTVLILLIHALFSQDITVPKGRRLKDIVKEKYTAGSLYVGATSSYGKLNTADTDILVSEFSYCTPANDFKQTAIHPTPDKWSWKKSDAWVKFAEENNLILRIHGPIGPQCSKWARMDARTPKELEDNLTEFLTELCKRYNGHKNIKWMDVVNETVDREGEWKASVPGVGGWELPWTEMGYEKNVPDKFENLGGEVPLYIIKSFQISTKHAPDIKLVYNQHAGMEEEMWDRVKDTILYLRSIGCRVDGLGWQGHISFMKGNEWETDAVNLEELENLIAWAHANDLEFHITENNIHVPHHEVDNVEEHAETFGAIFTSLLKMRGSGVVTYNLWDIADITHYKNKNKTKLGFWDSELKPKKSYYTIQKILENPPPAK